MSAHSQDEGTLRDRIDQASGREQSLAGAVAGLDRILAKLGREVAIVQGRLSQVQQELDSAEAKLAATRDDLVRERVRLLKLQHRLADGRVLLADQLVLNYKADRPDIVSVVMGSASFADLLDRFAFLKRIQNSNARVIDDVRAARDETEREAAKLARLETQRQTRAADVRRRHAALASMEAGLAQRQAGVQRARAARAAALQGARSDRLAAQRTLDKLIAERARAAVSQQGPGGPWAIPWAIVQCESGGQNLAPNRAGASGYYQFMRATWRGLGGSTPNAYQAPKAEQDRLAAQLWNGGAGAGNWVCAGLV